MITKSLQFKRVMSFTLLVLLLTAVGITKAYALDFTEGNLNYTVNDDGVSVTVTGHAQGTSYYGAVNIPDEVTYNSNTYSVTKIAASAFQNCTGITSVTIPCSMTFIGDKAFNGCTGLITLNYNAINCSLGTYNYATSHLYYNHWLHGCTALVNLNIGDGVQRIPNYFVCGYYYSSPSIYITSLTGSIIIPNTVTSIGSYAFYMCGNISSVTIGNSVQSIGTYAFASCSKLTSIVLPSSMTTVSNYTFDGCSLLSSVTIPNTIVSIGEYAFRNCKLASLEIPNSVVSIGTYSFYGNSSLTSLTFGENVASIGASAFYNCSSLTSLTFGENVASIGASAFYNCSSIVSLIIPHSIVFVGNSAFYGCSGLISVTLGNSVASIGNEAFYGCTSLPAITIPASVASIGNGVFGKCTVLGQITVAVGNTVYDSRNNCNAVIETASNRMVAGCMNTVIPNTVTIIGNRAFYYCTGLNGTLNLPNSVATIEAYAFCGCVGISGHLNLPDPVVRIEEGAFENCTGITSVTIPHSVTFIGASAFYNCTGLITLNYNAINCSLATSQWHWLRGCSSLVSLNIGDGVQTIPDDFICCYDSNSPVLTGTVVIPNTVTSIGSYAFYRCGNISSVTIGNSVQSIGTYAFEECYSLQSLVIPNSVVSVGSEAFKSCRNIASLSLGESVSSIGSKAFYDCRKIAQMYIEAVTPPAMGNNAFYDVPKDIPVYVPCDGLEDYTSANWGGFFNIIGLCDGEITATANPVGGGTISGAGSYHGGDTCTLTATSNGYLRFLYWMKNGEVASTNPSFSFIVAGDASYTACFGSFNEVVIGAGTATNSNLPSQSNYNYTISQQIYTAEEVRYRGTITSIVFYNGGTAKTRSYDIYMTHTTKTSFSSVTDWITVTESDRVFSGSVTMAAGNWTEIYLDIPFLYDGTANLALVVDDNTGSYSGGMACLVYDANGNQALYKCSDGTNYNPANPSVSGTLSTVKNQIKLTFGSQLGDVIVFADEAVKALCVGAWDEDGDGELNYEEAANITDLGNVFAQNTVITSFDELRYFTGITAMGANTFKGCQNLASVELPCSLADIGDYAFQGCDALGAIRSHAVVPPTLGQDVFDGVNTGITVYVPCGCAEAYSSMSWGGFSNFVGLCDGEITATAHPSEGGTVTGAGFYEGGDICTLVAMPNEHYTFVNWTKGGEEVYAGMNYSFMVTEAVDYVANFNLESFEVTATLIPETGGSISGTGIYGYGTTATLTVTPNTGYHVVSWMKDGSLVSTADTYSFTVTEDAHLVVTLEYAPAQAIAEGWNWCSTSVEMDGNNGLEQLENSLGGNGMIIKSRNNGYVEYYEVGNQSGWFGTLSSISNEQMYKIRSIANCNAVIFGNPASPSNHPITIANGWNWIGFPNNQAVNLSDAFAGFTPADGDVIKSRNAFANYNENYGWNGSMNSLEPGTGYMYLSNDTEQKTLIFQTGRGETVADNISTEYNMFQPRSKDFADNMTVTAVIDIDGVEIRSEEYELAAFMADECRGSVKLMYVEPIDRYIAFLTVFGEQGDNINFTVTDGTETIFSVNELAFVADATVGTLAQPYPVGCQSTAGIGEYVASTLNVYPNPSNGIFHIEGQGIRKVEVLNGLGQIVMSEESCSESMQINLSNNAKGVYMLYVVTDDGVMIEQLIKY